MASSRRQAGVVVLESTLITHGMPYPRNLESARALERIVREHGAEPATVAVLGGRIRIGLDDTELELLARTPNLRKLSAADLPYAVATGTDGSTTVAATMICAELAMFNVFVTGGIGGVHRDAETTFDVSADIEELARTPVVVVCSGAKAVLDLPKTLEALETRGVPVICYGTDEFPAFWSRSSGLSAPLRLDSVDALARFVNAKADLRMLSGTVVANPIPQESEIALGEMQPVIETALADARRERITGKAVTPFLLERIRSLTDGRSLEANIALLKSNARLGAELARALMREDDESLTKPDQT